MVMVVKNVKLGNIARLRQTILRHVLAAVLEGINLTTVKQAAYPVHLESINMLKEKKSVKTVRLDVRQTLLATIKVNVCCVLSVRRLHEPAVQNVKIVALEDMVLVAKNANLVNIVPLRLTILSHVLHAVLDGINPMLVKQFVFRVRLESINMLKEQNSVKTVKLDVQLALLETMQQSVMPV